MNIYLLDYLNMIMLRFGWFQSEDEAWEWVNTNDPERRDYYKVVVLDKAQADGTMSNRKYTRYVYQS